MHYCYCESGSRGVEVEERDDQDEEGKEKKEGEQRVDNGDKAKSVSGREELRRETFKGLAVKRMIHNHFRTVDAKCEWMLEKFIVCW